MDVQSELLKAYLHQTKEGTCSTTFNTLNNVDQLGKRTLLNISTLC